jgi:hypothetical protein
MSWKRMLARSRALEASERSIAASMCVVVVCKARCARGAGGGGRHGRPLPLLPGAVQPDVRRGGRPSQRRLS